jgi:hypothetical protein
MKTRFGFLKYVLPLLFIFACAKDNNNRNSGVAPIASTYYLSNGQCYQANTNQQVPINLCTQTGQGGYYLSNGQCYSSTGQLVQYNLCTGTGTNGGYYLSNGVCYSSQGVPSNMTYCQGGTSGGQTCMGTYYYYSGYGWATVNCSGQCSGYTLMNQQYQMVRCL